MRRLIALSAVLAVLAASTVALALPPYLEDYETGNTTSAITRVASGTNGVPSAGGSSWHGVTDPSGSHFTTGGGYDPVWNGSGVGGFITTMDIYIAPGYATSGFGFDITQALNNTTPLNTTGHIGDYVIVGAVSTQTNTVMFGASQNTNGVGGGVGTGTGSFFRGGGGVLVPPIEFGFQAGWYTLEWDFHDTGGFVEVTTNITDPSSVKHHIHTWQVTGWTGSSSVPIATSGPWHPGTSNVLGGHRYLWMLNENPSAGGIAVDNISIQYQPLAAIPLPLAFWGGLALLGGVVASRRRS